MSKRKAIALLEGFLCCFILVSVALAMSSAHYAINWDVIGGGGGPMSSASYAMNSTVGQVAIGPISSVSYRLGAGYWYGVVVEYRIFLPIIMKNYSP